MVTGLANGIKPAPDDNPIQLSPEGLRDMLKVARSDENKSLVIVLKVAPESLP